MVAVAVRCALAAVLLAAAVLKLARPRESWAGLASFGLRGLAARSVWAALVALEAGLAAGVAFGSDTAAYLAAALMAAFASAVGLALGLGRGGAACGCFGARSRISRVALARNVALAAAFAAVPFLDGLSDEAWLAAGLALALAGVATLTVAVLALARQLGELRLSLAPQAALELAHEGPELGSRTALIERFERDRETRLALAVFASPGCRVCRALKPSVALLARDPLVAVRIFDEERDADAWDALDVPGSPFAVALAPDGTVLAKGTFNTLGQLESVLATAERRQRDALGV